MAGKSRKPKGEIETSSKPERAKTPTPGKLDRPLPDRERIIFRHLGDQVSPGSTPGWWWTAELYNDDRPFPAGQAWVMVVPPAVTNREKYVTTVEIFYVLVSDDSRRKGVASRLVEACRERWPDAKLTPPMSKAGERLCAKFDPPPEPEDMFNPQALKRLRDQGLTRDDIRRLAREQVQALHDLLFNESDEPDTPAPRRRSGRKGNG